MLKKLCFDNNEDLRFVHMFISDLLSKQLTSFTNLQTLKKFSVTKPLPILAGSL